jgi:hypothetical protein
MEYIADIIPEFVFRFYDTSNPLGDVDLDELEREFKKSDAEHNHKQTGAEDHICTQQPLHFVSRFDS